MKLELDEVVPRFRVLPTQLVDVGDGIILRRGVERLKISGAAAQAVLESIFEIAGGPAGASVDEICDRFGADLQPAVRDLVDRLVRRRILVDADTAEAIPGDGEVEGAAEVFYWQFGASARTVETELAARSITVMGVNTISQQLTRILAASGVTRLSVVDHPLLRNLRLFGPDGREPAAAWDSGVSVPVDFDRWADLEPEVDCLVVTSDFGGLKLMREWNEFCVRFGIHFLPVVLQDMVGYLGPLVMPGETACFECLWARQNSHLADPERERAAEEAAFYGQLVEGSLPPMGAILGDLAAMELIKFYSGRLPGAHPGSLIEVDLMKPELTSRKVLKVPRCRICSPLAAHSTRTAESNVFMPGNEP